MARNSTPERGKMEINGHLMSWEIIRSEHESAFGIQQSRIHELNLYKDGTMTADFNKKWLKVPYVDDEESHLCIQHLIEKYGHDKKSRFKKKGE